MHQDTFNLCPSLVYSVARSITDGKSQHGFIEVQNRYEQLEDFCALDPQLGSVALFSVEGEILYPQGAAGQDLSFLQGLYATIESKNKPADVFTEKGQVVSYQRSEYSGWLTVLYNSTTAIVPFGFQFIAVAVLLFLALTLGTLVVLRYLTNRLTAPLVNLNKALSEVSLDNLSLALPDSGDTVEIQNINKSFQMMFSQLRVAIAHSVQSRANEERANYLALQSQLNPHTIYNTIGMIESVSYMHGGEVVAKLCRQFSQMLRYISDYSERQYIVRDELQYLQNYTALIERRYDGKLGVEITVEESLLQKAISAPPLQRIT